MTDHHERQTKGGAWSRPDIMGHAIEGLQRDKATLTGWLVQLHEESIQVEQDSVGAFVLVNCPECEEPLSEHRKNCELAAIVEEARASNGSRASSPQEAANGAASERRQDRALPAAAREPDGIPVPPRGGAGLDSADGRGHHEGVGGVQRRAEPRDGGSLPAHLDGSEVRPADPVQRDAEGRPLELATEGLTKLEKPAINASAVQSLEDPAKSPADRIPAGTGEGAAAAKRAAPDYDDSHKSALSLGQQVEGEEARAATEPAETPGSTNVAAPDEAPATATGTQETNGDGDPEERGSRAGGGLNPGGRATVPPAAAIDDYEFEFRAGMLPAEIDGARELLVQGERIAAEAQRDVASAASALEMIENDLTNGAGGRTGTPGDGATTPASADAVATGAPSNHGETTALGSGIPPADFYETRYFLLRGGPCNGEACAFSGTSADAAKKAAAEARNLSLEKQLSGKVEELAIAWSDCHDGKCRACPKCCDAAQREAQEARSVFAAKWDFAPETTLDEMMRIAIEAHDAEHDRFRARGAEIDTAEAAAQEARKALGLWLAAYEEPHGYKANSMRIGAHEETIRVLAPSAPTTTTQPATHEQPSGKAE